LCQMLAAKEEYLRVSRTFLREFVRALLRVDFDFALFAHYLFQTLTDKYLPSSAPPHLFKSLMELCWMLPFLAVTPTVREGTQFRRSANVTLSQVHLDALLRFYAEVCKFFEECVDFLVSHHAYCTDTRLFVYSFYRLLYLAPVDYYASVDNWPLEADVTQFVRAIADAPLSEALLLKILRAGAEQSVPIDAADAIDLVENLSKRASISSPLNGSVVSMIGINDCDAVNTLFATTVYRPPTTFQLRENELPALSVRTLYWKAWIIAVMWVSLNKHSLIKEAYVKFPTLKAAIQILLTWDYRFPPLASAGDAEGAERMMQDDERELNEEKQKIRKLEARLAGMDVDDADSKLLGKLCSLNPTGVCRRPPDSFLRDLEKLNEDLDLSGSLSECRDPDLLADIIRSQGSACALPSIVNVVESNASAMLHLPLECVCELFLHYLLTSTSPPANIKKPSNEKLNALRQRLRDSLRGPAANESTVMETLQYMTTRLGAHSLMERSAAAHALALFLQPDANTAVLPVNVDASPTGFLHMVSSFDLLKGRICTLLAQLCPVETKSSRLTEYIDFLIEHADPSTSHLVAHHISSVVERLTDVREEEGVHASALRFFDSYVRSACKSESTWTPELVQLLPTDVKKVSIEFCNSQKEKLSAEMISSSIGAVLQLLCTQRGEQNTNARTALMDLFFPAHGHRPKVALSEMKQEDALKFVQSFGLTSYSCSKLFATLDKADFVLEDDVLREACKAAPFIRAYKRRGAIGADRFLARLSERLQRDKALKMEVDEEHTFRIVEKQPPSFMDMCRSGETTNQRLSNEQILQYIDMALTQNSFEEGKWYRALAEVARNVECARAVIAVLKRKPSLLNNCTIVVPLLGTVGTLRDKVRCLCLFV
uniref:Integrator complex subunit 1 n=1 Tax=Toxocara canis TaxID=6265 RepID=A0A183V8M6_TOXCA